MKVYRFGAVLCVGFLISVGGSAQSVARQWNELLLESIRKDYARPTNHSRNLFHVAAAMWDGWAVYDPGASKFITRETHLVGDIETARAETISFAAYRVLTHRFAESPGASDMLPLYDAKMDNLGYNKLFSSTVGDTPAAIGNRIAALVIAFGLTDGSNEENDYGATNGYEPSNPPLVVGLPGNPDLEDPDHWQPLALDFFVDQSGNVIVGGYPDFLGPHWGHVTPFALDPDDYSPDKPGVCLDQGAPPSFDGPSAAEYRDVFLEVIRFSSELTPDDGVMMDVSPANLGNNSLGTYDGEGYDVNPVTGQPYTSQIVPRGDYSRVLAEFWADGPDSETPPGHWTVLANYVSDSGVEKRIGGVGPLVNDLEWDVKMYLAICGAVHDAAVVAWGHKGYYDFIRPISAIRYLCGLGQNSDPNGPSYHPDGIPLEPGLVEVITLDTIQPGGIHEHLAGPDQENLGKIALYTWPGEPEEPSTQYSGVTWILADDWVPYQRSTFVTPPFAGYVSGHSTFSRAAAEILTHLTGSSYFPGGLGTFQVTMDDFLVFEQGPSVSFELQWATYYDAADEAGISRIWGGIHPRADDLPGRIMGSEVGHQAWARALEYFSGAIPCPEDFDPDGLITPLDLAAVAPSWGTPGAGDLNGDQVVNLLDYSLISNLIGQECL